MDVVTEAQAGVSSALNLISCCFTHITANERRERKIYRPIIQKKKRIFSDRCLRWCDWPTYLSRDQNAAHNPEAEVYASRRVALSEPHKHRWHSSHWQLHSRRDCSCQPEQQQPALQEPSANHPVTKLPAAPQQKHPPSAALSHRRRLFSERRSLKLLTKRRRKGISLFSRQTVTSALFNQQCLLLRTHIIYLHSEKLRVHTATFLTRCSFSWKWKNSVINCNQCTELL